MIVFLVGFMGCGKSTVGIRLARDLEWEFVDLDRAIEDAEGMSVSEIFRQKGEDGFRTVEADMLRQIDDMSDAVVSLGGGAPCFSDNMDVILSKGLAVYMRLAPESLAARLEHGKAARPKLRGLDGDELRDWVASVLRERERHYMRAHITVDLDGLSKESAVRHLRDSLLEYLADSQHQMI